MRTTTDDVIQIGPGDKELTERLEQELMDLNVQATGADDQRGLSVSVTDSEGELVAGLSGWTWGGCGGIELLWVRADRRHQGWGSRLLDAAEDEARSRGCTRMVVSSLTFQAPPFYRRHGYRETGRTEGLPGDHADVHFWKSLTDPPAPGRQRLVLLLDLPPRCELPALPSDLLARHEGRAEQRLRTPDDRTEIHTLSFPSATTRAAFLADPQHASHRDELTAAGLTLRVLETQEA